jgi:hypothetical protein
MKSKDYKPELYISSEDINNLYFNISNLSSNNPEGYYIQKSNDTKPLAILMVPKSSQQEIYPK